MAMGRDADNNTYVGTLFQSDLETGERDVASLQLYPCNNLRLRAISNAELTFLTPNGEPYSGKVTIRGGAYKNGVYCTDAKIRVGDALRNTFTTASNSVNTLFFHMLKTTSTPFSSLT